MGNILVIDDDKDICMLLDRFLTKNGFEVTVANSGKNGLQSVSQKVPDLILCDFRLDDMNGADLLEKVKEIDASIPVIIMTGYSDVRVAVQIMKSGAVDYVTKPLLPDEILVSIKRILKSVKEKNDPVVEQKKETSGKAVARKTKTKYIFGKSEIFKAIMEQVQLVAPTNYSVIIYGESGSGKESIANEIHNRSLRAKHPFVPIDCGALSKELAASELFGHEKGAFTGALNQKIGSFEHANGGTIFLDEIANLSYDVQVALLRVIQERKLRRVGGVKEIDLDVRIIIASNERLSELTKKGKFREDLYHRFNEFSIELPPLRQRGEDIMQYAEFFLEQACEELNKSVKHFSKEVVRIFHGYSWPGNLRELNNVIKRAALLSSGDSVEVVSLPFEITHFEKLNFDKEDEYAMESKGVTYSNAEPVKKSLPLSDLGMKHASIDAEFELILEALKKCNYNKSKAAILLNIDRKTLYNKMKQYKEFNGEL